MTSTRPGRTGARDRTIALRGHARLVLLLLVVFGTFVGPTRALADEDDRHVCRPERAQTDA